LEEINREPTIFMPTEAVTATGTDGQKLVFLRIPQLELMIKQVIAARPKEYTYRWAYHPTHKVHVLLFQWPSGEGAGVAIPEGAGDAVLTFMLGTSHIYITSEAVQERLSGDVTPEEIGKVVLGNTVGLPDVKFKPEP